MFGNVLIIGDSYSRFKDYIPEGFAIYYREDGGDTDVHSVDKTWWHQLIYETNSNLVLNSSYSGSSWAGSPLGEYKFSDWKKEDLYFFLPAISYLIHTLKELLPKAQIICLINTELKPEISEGIKKPVNIIVYNQFNFQSAYR